MSKEVLVMAESNRIRWPPHYDPLDCPVHVRNELEMDSPPSTVWAWLVRAQLWPTWYPNSANIKFLNGQAPDLKLGTRFKWKTFGITVESTVLEFVFPERLAWNARALGFDGYHAWLIQQTDEDCKVLTEETQRGWLPILQKAFAPTRIERLHQVWLERLKENAAKGLPP